MIFQTQNQVNCILIFLFFGFLVEIIREIFFVLFFEKYQKKLIKIIINTIFYAFFNTFFIILLNFFNCGKFSITLYFSFVVGSFTLKYLTQNLVVILQAICYTKITNLLKHIKKKNQRNKKSNPKEK